MKKLYLIILLISAYLFSFSQTVTETYHTPFETNNQNLWQQGTTGIFQIDHVFFETGFNESLTFGPIYSVAGFDFGASIIAGAWAEVGSGLQINFGTEQLDIDYDANMNIVRPTNFTFDPGDQLVINTGFTPSPPATSNIVTDTYDANIRLWFKFGMGMNLSANICVFSCANVDILNLNLPTEYYDMVSISNVTGISLLAGLYTWPVSEAFPFSYTDPEGISTTDITLPSNAGANVYLQNNELHSFVNPTDPNDAYFKFYFSIPKFIGALHIPYVSAVFANLSNSWAYGPFYLNYIVLESGFRLGLYHKQHLVLDPTMKGRFDFDTKLDYQIINPTNGSVISEGYDSVINYTVGNRIKIDYPCNYDFIDVTPSFEMENTFTNHTYDSIALDFVFQMLQFDMGMNSITVIPAFCVPIYYPCPTWSNPFKICSYDLCTPAVTFGGFDVGFGPLVDWQPNLFNIKYDWCNNSWEMLGFNSFPNQAPFRLEPRKFSVELNITDVLCHGEATGTATATVTNGNPPYTYEWSNGTVVSSSQPTNTQTGLEAGTHWVIVRDTKECSVFDSKVIIEPEEDLSTTYVSNDPECFDSFDGSIDLEVTGGTSPYSYSWTSGDMTEDISNLDAGTYDVIVTDFNGCTISESVVLNKPEDIIVGIDSENVPCFGEATGSIELNVVGGTPPYTYDWSNGTTENTDYSLIPGTYTITIQDSHLCEKIETVDITGPGSPLIYTSSVIDALCYGDSTGNISVIASGGTPPYSYTWFNNDFNIINQSTPSLVDMPAGTYTLALADSLLCSDTLDFVINQPDSLYYEFDVQDVLCKGLAQGEITISVSGGVSPYEYLWDGGFTDLTITDLIAGEYFVTISDWNGCETITSVVVNEPDEELTVETDITDVLCHGDSTGSIEAIVAGGTPPYTYIWSTLWDQVEVIDAPAGIYTVTVTDDNNCEAYSGGVINEPSESLDIDYSVTPVTCFGYNDGTIDVILSGGTLPYSLVWDDDEYILSTNQQSIDSLFTGFYNIRLMDANNCYINAEFFIDSPDSVSIDLTSTIVSCYNGSDGSLTPVVSGGTEPYTFEWSNGDDSETLEDVSAGLYQLSVFDANDCQYTTTGIIESFSEIILAYEIVPVTCKDESDAAINVVVTGGTGNYFFVWSNGETTQSIEELLPGIYSLTLSDDNHCESEYEFEIEENYLECLRIPTSFSPNDDGINDTWIISSIDTYPDATVQIFNKWGNIIYETVGTYIPWDGTYNGKSLPSGTYYHIINLNNGDEPYTGTITILR